MRDLIDRQAAIDAAIEAVDSWDGMTSIGRQKRIEKYINALPSAEPEIIHCGECAFAEVADHEDVQDGYVCQFHPGSIWFSGSFCSWVKAKMEVDT